MRQRQGLFAKSLTKFFSLSSAVPKAEVSGSNNWSARSFSSTRYRILMRFLRTGGKIYALFTHSVEQKEASFNSSVVLSPPPNFRDDAV